jgi:CPA1 family monovalent cation:H+ antiporter
MHDTEVIVAVVLAAVAALLLLALIIRIPYPILLVVGGLALGFVPGMPDVTLNPDLVLLIALPPLLYAAAFFSSLRDLRANLQPIGLLAIGLVLATMLVVAVVAHAAIDGMSWPAAFVLGAIVSPTDPTAASAIARRLGVPRRIVTIVEGESLINDATALVAYKFAVAAVVTGSFSASEAGLRFVVNAVAGVAIGLAVAWVIAQVRRGIEHPPTEITISLFTPYFAYLPASAAGVSAVLAAVAAGIYLGWRSPQLISPSTRIQAFSVWEMLIFLLNSLLFVLVGLQLPMVIDRLSGQSATTLAGYAALVSAVVIATRIAWVFPLTYLPRRLSHSVRKGEPTPPWQETALVAWVGMRGAVSLAAALALPLTVNGGRPFPDRDLIVFLTFAVIVATLVLQGLSMPAMVHLLGVEDDGIDQHEENKARLLAARAAVDRIDELSDEDWVRDDSAERMRNLYQYRQRRFGARFKDSDEDGADIEQRSRSYQRLRREALEAERSAVVRLRNEGRINDEVMRRIERDLDLEDERLEV